MKEETKASYDKETYIKKKREQLDNAYKTIDEGLEEITTNPNFFKEYLTVQGKFDLYTPRNAILIAKQLPNAIQLKEMKIISVLKVSILKRLLYLILENHTLPKMVEL